MDTACTKRVHAMIHFSSCSGLYRPQRECKMGYIHMSVALERNLVMYKPTYFATRGGSRKKIEKKRIPRVPTSKKV